MFDSFLFFNDIEDGSVCVWFNVFVGVSDKGFIVQIYEKLIVFCFVNWFNLEVLFV